MIGRVTFGDWFTAAPVILMRICLLVFALNSIGSNSWKQTHYAYILKRPSTNRHEHLEVGVTGFQLEDLCLRIMSLVSRNYHLENARVNAIRVSWETDCFQCAHHLPGKLIINMRQLLDGNHISKLSVPSMLPSTQSFSFLWPRTAGLYLKRTA